MKYILIILSSLLILTGCNPFKSDKDKVVGLWHVSTFINKTKLEGKALLQKDGTELADMTIYSEPTSVRIQIEGEWVVSEGRIIETVKKSNSSIFKGGETTTSKIIDVNDKYLTLELETKKEIVYKRMDDDSINNFLNGFAVSNDNSRPASGNNSSENYGYIIGSAGYPSEGLPSDLMICAKNVTDGHLYKTKDINRQSSQDVPNYVLKVPKGEYYVYAITFSLKPTGDSAYYDEFVTCGLNANCSSHKKIIVNVSPSDTVKKIDPNDWYNK